MASADADRCQGRHRSHGRLADELEIAHYLVEADAPVVGPSDEIPRRVHHLDRFDVTFWRYAPQHNNEVGAKRLAHALRRLHDALGNMPTTGLVLPSFQEELDAARRLLADSSALPLLRAADRQVLAAVLASCDAEARYQHHTVHGSPHLFNVLVVDGEPVFIDFETVCLGPWEWDVAHLEEEVALHYPDDLESHLLEHCRNLVRAKTAVWCWDKAAESSEMRWHAEQHLENLKQSAR